MNHIAKIHVWLDCDPGLDDTFAIILAASHPQIDLLGISTSPGNSSIQNTTRNALDILHNIGKPDIPVVMGSSHPLGMEASFAAHMHGSNGLGGVEIPHSERKAISTDRFGAIYKIIMECPGKVAFVNTGSLTNLALLLTSYPELKEKISQISIMGGAIGEGNITPAAEFNIYFDPIAARETLSYGIPFTMVPLELTHTNQANLAVLEKFKKYQSPFAKCVVQLIEAYRGNYFTVYGLPHPPLHDPCAVFYLLEKEAFKGRHALVTIDTFPTSYGRTNCNFRYNKDEQPNCFVAQKMNVDRFWEVMIQAYEKCVPMK